MNDNKKELEIEVQRLTAELKSMKRDRDHYWDAAENQLARSKKRRDEISRLRAALASALSTLRSFDKNEANAIEEKLALQDKEPEEDNGN